MRLADIRAQLRFRLQEPQSTGRFSDAELDSYINRGQAEVADQLEPLVKVTSFNFGAGVATQPLPDNLLRIHRASIGGTALRTTDPLALDATSTTWEGATGTPTHYFIQGNDLRLYPIPDSPVTVDVTHSYLPEDLVDDTTSSVSLGGWRKESSSTHWGWLWSPTWIIGPVMPTRSTRSGWRGRLGDFATGPLNPPSGSL